MPDTSKVNINTKGTKFTSVDGIIPAANILQIYIGHLLKEQFNMQWRK